MSLMCVAIVTDPTRWRSAGPRRATIARILVLALQREGHTHAQPAACQRKRIEDILPSAGNAKSAKSAKTTARLAKLQLLVGGFTVLYATRLENRGLPVLARPALLDSS